MSTRLQIAGLVFMMVNAVAFGVGIVPVLLIPALANNAFETIPAVVIASFVTAILVHRSAPAGPLLAHSHELIRHGA